MGGTFSAASKPPPQLTINASDAEIPLIPPIIFALLLAACLTLGKMATRYRFLPDYLASLRVRLALLALLVAVSIPPQVLSAGELHEAGSGVAFTPVGGLATGGTYSYSRNPLYVMLTFVVLPGLGVTFDSAWPVFAAGPMFVYLSKVVIPAEEAFLAKHYPQEFEAYAAATPRWLL